MTNEEVDPALSLDLVATSEAKALLARPLFATTSRSLPRGRLGGHIAVNGYDLARVEKAAYERGAAAARAALSQEAATTQEEAG